MNYSLCNVKLGIGHDLNGAQADVKRGSKKIVTIVDDGFGSGIYDLYWHVESEDIKKYTAEIKPFCEQLDAQDGKGYLQFVMKDQGIPEDSLWAYLFKHLLKLHEDAKNAKKMKPTANQAVWLVQEKNPSVIQRGKTYLSVGPMTETDAQVIQDFVKDGINVDYVRRLSTKAVVEIK